MKFLFITLLVAFASPSFAQCPNRVNTNTGEIHGLVSMVENECEVKLNADTISSLNVYYYASADKSVTLKFELLKAKKDAGDTAFNLPSKVLRIEVIAPAASADKLFAEMKNEVKGCSSFKIKRTNIKYSGETAEINKMADNKKRIVIY